MKKDTADARAARHAKLLPAHARRAAGLLDIAERACRVAAKHERAALWEALRRIEMPIGVRYDEWGTTLEEAEAHAAFRSAEELAEALAADTFEARTVAPLLLARLDPAAAANLVLDFHANGSEDYFLNYHEKSLEDAFRTTSVAVSSSLPPDAVVPLFLEGKFPIEQMTDAHLAALPVDGLAAAVRSTALGYLHAGDALRILKAHAELGTLEASHAFLDGLGDRLFTHAALVFGPYLMGLLGRRGHAPAIPTLERLYRAAGDAQGGALSLQRSAAYDALVALGHRPVLELVAVTLPQLVAHTPLIWDAHHTAEALRAPIRAMFALAPEDASERFAPYFTPSAVAKDRGAKVAHDILQLGLAVGTGDPTWLDRDPRWFDVAARLSSHPRLGRIAKTILARLPAAERKARLAAAGLAAKPRPKKSAKTAKKSAQKRKASRPAKTKKRATS